MANWENKFVSRSGEDHIVFSLSDYSKYQAYTHNFSENNLINNMHIIFSDFWDSKSKNGCNKW